MSDPLQAFPPDTVAPFVSSAATGNAVLAAARDWRALRRGSEGSPGAARPQVQPALTVWVRNDTGGSLPAFSVLALGEPVASPADEPYVARDRPVFPGTAPAGATDVFAVTTEPAKVGGLVRATVTGATPAYLSVSDEAHACAVPAAATTSTLASAAAGPARVVWKESGTGAKWAMVLIGRDTAAGGGSGTVPVRGYLTALSGGKWKWKPVSLNASGAFTLGTETATFNATELAPPYSAEAWAAAAVGTIVDMYRTTDATGGAEQWVFLSLALANDDPGNPGGADARGGLLSSEFQYIPGQKFFTEGVGGHTVNGQGYGDADEDNWAADPAFLWQGPSGTFVQSGLITDPFGYYGSTCIRFGYVTGPTIATYGGPAVDIGIGDFFNFTPGPYVRAGHFQIRVNANTVHTGAFGTLGDGSTVEGGIITAIVGGGTVIDGGAL